MSKKIIVISVRRIDIGKDNRKIINITSDNDKSPIGICYDIRAHKRYWPVYKNSSAPGFALKFGVK